MPKRRQEAATCSGEQGSVALDQVQRLGTGRPVVGHMQGYMYARAGRSREGPEVSHRARGRAVDDPDFIVRAAKLHDIGLSDRRRLSQKLDRPARCFHPRDRRRDAPVSWPALHRDQPAHVSSFGARGVASVANPLPPRQCPLERRNIARAAPHANAWSPVGVVARLAKAPGLRQGRQQGRTFGANFGPAALA
jgi:hypothetical protein